MFLNFLIREIPQFLRRAPGLLQRGFDLIGGQLQVHEKIIVTATGAIIGLQRRHPQKITHEREVEVQQKCHVKKQEVFLATLRVAGKFQPVQ